MSSRGNMEKEEKLKELKQFLHPKSRRCIAMVKKLKKDSKKEKAKQESKLKLTFLSEKLLWFQKNIDPNIFPYTAAQTAELVQKYIARNDEELEQIQLKRSIGERRNRQHIGREDAIKMTKERETGDFKSCGLEIPNIMNISHYNMLKKWNGDLKFLPNFKLLRFSKRLVDEELKKKEKSENSSKQENNESELKPTTQNIPNKSKDLETNKEFLSSKENEEVMETE